MTQKTIVIIGAGFFGIPTANKLVKSDINSEFKIKLITASNYTVLLPAACRLGVTGNTKKHVLPLEELVDKSVEIVIDEVTNFDRKSVSLKSGGQVEFDALVIATGSKSPDPIGTTHEFKDDYQSYYDKQAERFKNSKNIVLIGGGYVNVEIVGELLHFYKKEIESGEKNITVIHNSDKLLPDSELYSTKFRDTITDYISRTPVKLVFNAKGEVITNHDGTQSVTANGETFKADFVIYGTGRRPTFPHTDLPISDEKGFIKVHNSFLVDIPENTNIFAIGDVTNFFYSGLQKLGEWSDVLSSNIRQVLQRSDSSGSEAHDIIDTLTKAEDPRGLRPSIMKLGPEESIGQLVLPIIGPIIAPKFVLSWIKAKRAAPDHIKKDLFAVNEYQA